MDHCLLVKVIHGASFPICTLIIVMMIMVFIADQLLVLSIFSMGVDIKILMYSHMSLVLHYVIVSYNAILLFEYGGSTKQYVDMR